MQLASTSAEKGEACCDVSAEWTAIGREAYQRTTTYGTPTDERRGVARAHASTGYASTGKSLRLLPLDVVGGH